MKKIILFCSVIVISLQSSNTTAQNKPIQKNTPAKTVLAFLDWYRNNKSALNQINLINNYLSEDPSKPYRINLKNTEQYLYLIQKSGYLSDEYLNNWRVYFKKCDNQFTMQNLFEGPAEGLEFDPVMLVQDYGDDLNQLSKAKVLKAQISNQTAYITIEYLYHDKYIYKLSKKGTNWLIDGIKLISNTDMEGNAVHPNIKN